jgi:hypothetical protein
MSENTDMITGIYLTIISSFICFLFVPYSSPIIFSFTTLFSPLIQLFKQNWKTRMTAYEHLKRDMAGAAEQGTTEIFGQFGT